MTINEKSKTEIPITGREIPPMLQRDLSALVEKYMNFTPGFTDHGERKISFTVTFTDGKPSIKGIIIT